MFKRWKECFTPHAVPLYPRGMAIKYEVYEKEVERFIELEMERVKTIVYAAFLLGTMAGALGMYLWLK